MHKLATITPLFIVLALCAVPGCEEAGDAGSTSHAGHDHDHGHDHDDADHHHDDGHADHDDHDHETVPLDTTTAGDFEIECHQGHGQLEPGKEMHLTVTLPESDSGATVVRAWIGTEDRLASMVARGEYAESHGGYDIHAEAPDPLPEGAMWWIELERPDGTTHLGSIAAH